MRVKGKTERDGDEEGCEKGSDSSSRHSQKHEAEVNEKKEGGNR